MDQTLIICKPDAVERGLVGEIIGRFEQKGLKLVAVELQHLSEMTLARHYHEHLGKDFYGDLVNFMSRGPVVVAVVGGAEDVWQVVRQMVGATNSLAADPGTIRGDLGFDFTENLVHASDSAPSAKREIEIFFPSLGQSA